ncbi:MAG: helix-turn-helix transcriptional regulator [Deltaproteobacteria bacterium]|nr:helix-turn-helix transcriptional regulator [Deltaproteobacteria bacterium]
MLKTSAILSKLKALRKTKGLSQESVAKALEVDRTTYIRKENGRIPITTEEWIRLALTMGEEVGYFFESLKSSCRDVPVFTELRNRLSTEERADMVRCLRLILEVTDKEDLRETKKD